MIDSRMEMYVESILADARVELMNSLARDKVVGWYGSCGTEYHEGREAVMPRSSLQIDLAECEDPCTLQEDFDGGSQGSDGEGFPSRRKG